MISKLVIQNLTKKYKGGFVANKEITLNFNSKEITAIIGHNGAGKTTLLNQICGLIKPTNGNIYINDNDIIKNPKLGRKLVSSMPQFQIPLKGVTIFQAIKTIAMIKGISKSEAVEKTKNIIKYLQIKDWMNTPGERLSGGLHRLTSFAMSVIDENKIIILDEPTNDIDPLRRILIWKYLRKLALNGAVILLVTHNLLEAEKYSDRYILLDKGMVKKDIRISQKQYEDIKHTLIIYDVEENDINESYTNFQYKYEVDERKAMIFLLEEEIVKAIYILLDLIKKRKTTNYELKIANLYDNYKE